MSILIKGMKMPVKQPLRIVLNPNGQLFVDHGVHFEKYEAAEVPAPHGPLIDANEIIEVQMLDEMYEEWTLKTMSVAEYIAFAADTPPTIIEAEEKSNG